jgi:hypothetical protein
MKDKLGAITIIVLFIGILMWLIVQILDNKIDNNCWKQYSTEQASIENCENHNG